MQPTITFHDVARVEFECTSTHTREDGSAFAARRLVLTDSTGHRFTVTLFGETAEALQVHEDPPECGHSACRQNWIETGETECIALTAAHVAQAEDPRA